VQRTARAGAPVLEVEAHRGAWAGAGRFLRLGVEHIFGGLDHIAFLIGVLLLGGTLAQLLGIVDARWREAQFATTSLVAAAPYRETTAHTDVNFTPGNPLNVRATVALYF